MGIADKGCDIFKIPYFCLSFLSKLRCNNFVCDLQLYEVLADQLTDIVVNAVINNFNSLGCFGP